MPRQKILLLWGFLASLAIGLDFYAPQYCLAEYNGRILARGQGAERCRRTKSAQIAAN